VGEPLRPGKLEIVDLETARRARGLRLVLITGVPSPWSDAARWILGVKGIDALGVRFRPGDAAVIGWTGVPNAPVALYDDEPPQSGWQEILALAERLDGQLPLVPRAPERREQVLAMGRDLCAEWGVAWCRRLLVIHTSLVSDGRVGFPLPLARHLAARYGYAPERIPAAVERLVEVMLSLDAALAASHAAGHRYLCGAALSAADLYFAAALGAIVPLPQGDRAIIPALRPGFEALPPEVAAAVTPALRAHRDLLWSEHLRALHWSKTEPAP
jgi:glutathione S-transferase